MEKTLNTPARAMSRRSLVAFGLTALFAGTLAGCGAKPADTAGSHSPRPSSCRSSQPIPSRPCPRSGPLHREDRRDLCHTQFKASGDLIEQIRAGAQADA
ncbi:MAG: hypothetical protein ACLTKG_04300 [Collinsella intestinalis]